jgi:adenosine deaminase
MQKNESVGMSKRSYIEAVLEGLRAVSSVEVDFIPHTEELKNLSNPLFSATDDKCNENTRKKIFVRLLLSIDRRETTEAAMETVSIMHK